MMVVFIALHCSAIVLQFNCDSSLFSCGRMMVPMGLDIIELSPDQLAIVLLFNYDGSLFTFVRKIGCSFPCIDCSYNQQDIFGLAYKITFENSL